MLGKKCALIRLPTKTTTRIPGVRKPHTGHRPMSRLPCTGDGAARVRGKGRVQRSECRRAAAAGRARARGLEPGHAPQPTDEPDDSCRRDHARTVDRPLKVYLGHIRQPDGQVQCDACVDAEGHYRNVEVEAARGVQAVGRVSGSEGRWWQTQRQARAAAIAAQTALAALTGRPAGPQAARGRSPCSTGPCPLQPPTAARGACY
jgi:hypothetical protein